MPRRGVFERVNPLGGDAVGRADKCYRVAEREM